MSLALTSWRGRWKEASIVISIKLPILDALRLALVTYRTPLREPGP